MDEQPRGRGASSRPSLHEVASDRGREPRRASAPELLVRELVERLSTRFDVTEQEVETNRETIAFKLPRALDAA